MGILGNPNSSGRSWALVSAAPLDSMAARPVTTLARTALTHVAALESEALTPLVPTLRAGSR